MKIYRDKEYVGVSSLDQHSSGSTLVKQYQIVTDKLYKLIAEHEQNR